MTIDQGSETVQKKVWHWREIQGKGSDFIYYFFSMADKGSSMLNTKVDQLHREGKAKA